MKILICVDGSESSKKALEKASVIAQGCNVHEVAVIYVYNGKIDFSEFPTTEGTTITAEKMEKFRNLQEKHKEESREILKDAVDYLEKKNIQARGIFKEGHPSNTIVNVGCEEGYDMIVLGSRGRSGLNKVLLGSVSSAVVQGAKGCSILTVK